MSRSPGASPDPLLDPARLEAVARVAAAASDARGLDRLTRLAALLLDAPRAQVSLIGIGQSVPSGHGVETGGPPTDTAKSLCSLTVRRAAPLAVEDAVTDTRTAALPPVRSGAVGSYLGVPLVDGQGHVLGALCVMTAEPRTWTPEQVGLLGELAGSVVAELELRALTLDARSTAARLGLALAAADIGSFELDAATGALTWDERLIRSFGYDAATFVPHLDSFTDRVHPDDRARVAVDIADALAERRELSTEYRVVRPDGATRWFLGRGRLLPGGEAGRLVGVAYDSTELRDARDRVARVLETIPDAFYSLDDQWRFTYVNKHAERVLHRSASELVGQSLWTEFPQATGTVFQHEYERAARTGESVTFEAEYPELGWFEVRAWPAPDGLSVYFREITARREADRLREKAVREREQAVVDREAAYLQVAAANDRLTLLSEASVQLSESLEPGAVLQTLSSLVVPSLGTWVVVALRDATYADLTGREESGDSEAVHVVEVSHADPDRLPALAGVVGALSLSTRDPVGAGAVIASGEAEWLPEVPDEALVVLAPDAQSLDDMRALRLSSAWTLPLVSRGGVLGAMTVAEPAAGRMDRGLLSDLARRAAVALDNALLYGAERRTGVTLQRSLLPRALPELPGILSAVRYQPGTTGAQVGGDWYQGVQVGDGLVLAMGDVMGHGMRSAARMGQLRAIVATLALQGLRPGEVLRRLSSDVDVLLDLELATLLLASYDPTRRRLVVASAGHPPPLLAALGLDPVYVDVEPGPPIGTMPSDYPEVELDVPPGATLVLYTDGLVEDRAESISDGLERMRKALREVQLPPEAVCDHLLGEMGRVGGGEDDVALLVISHAP